VTSIYILLCVCGAAAIRFAGIIGNEVDFGIAHKVINECENLQSVKVCPKCPSVNPGYFFAAVATELSWKKIKKENIKGVKERSIFILAPGICARFSYVCSPPVVLPIVFPAASFSLSLSLSLSFPLSLGLGYCLDPGHVWQPWINNHSCFAQYLIAVLPIVNATWWSWFRKFVKSLSSEVWISLKTWLQE
jgi:hypothetical protein